jgi:hypothetical protein
MTRRALLIVLVIVLVPLAGHAVLDQIEASWFAREVARLAARGEPVSLSFQESVLPAEEQRKAARLYAAAADLSSWKHRDDPQLWSRELEVERTLTSEELDRRWRDVDREPAFDLLAAATPLDFAGFGPLPGSLNDNASPLQGLAAMNGLRTDVLAARGDYQQAAAALVQTLRLQRTIVRQLYRTAVADRYFGSLSMLLRRAPPDAAVLSDLQRAFEALPDEDTLAQQMRLERARQLGFAWPYPPGNAAWALRLRPVPAPRTAFESFVFFVMRPSLTRMTRSTLPMFENTIRVAGLPWPQKYEAVRKIDTGLSGGKTYSFASWRFSASDWPMRYLQSVVPLAGQELAIRRTAIATLAAERYRRAHDGMLPPTLEALVPEYLSRVPLDPFTGKPLLYLATSDAYVIYSVDRNRVDDHGVINMFGAGRDPLPADRAARDLGIRIPLASKT